MEIAVKNRFELGEQLELMTPQGNFGFTLEHLENQRGENLTVAPGSGYTVRIGIPKFEQSSYGLLLKNLVS